jgi:hypothetical protein
MADPVSRLQLAQQEIDRTFGPDYAREHPELVAVVVQSAASDYAALAIARGLQSIAAALIEPEEEAQRIVPARELLRARP